MKKILISCIVFLIILGYITFINTEYTNTLQEDKNFSTEQGRD